MSILAQIGSTPLFQLKSPNGVEIYAKAEYLNPSGSLKDRPALTMMGAVYPEIRKNGQIILDSSSGNAGISLAMVGAAMGIPVTICLSASATPARKALLKSYGATLIETDPALGSDGSQDIAKKLHEDNPEKYHYLNQYDNYYNWVAHRGTGAEIWKQTSERVTHFVTGVGTSGLFRGVSSILKDLNPKITTSLVKPVDPTRKLTGLRDLSHARVPGIFDPSLVDQTIEVTTDEGLTMMRYLARRGILVGPSSGANVAAAFKLAENLPEGSVIVTVLCDSGNRYPEGMFAEPN